MRTQTFSSYAEERDVISSVISAKRGTTSDFDARTTTLAVFETYEFLVAATDKRGRGQPTPSDDRYFSTTPVKPAPSPIPHPCASQASGGSLSVRSRRAQCISHGLGEDRALSGPRRAA